MPVIVTLWWLFFWTALGLCVGSFLNVVIYRLPRDKSLRDPVWSACPSCRHQIRWTDNIPLLSYIRLRGRCRDCDAYIAPQYLFIEASTALVVLLLLDAFFVGQVREGLSQSRFGLTDHLSSDWPILAAHVVLFASLLAMSAIDLEHYWVDVRFTNLATACGFFFHALWTPDRSEKWFRPGDSLAVMSFFGVGGLLLVWLWLIRRPPAHEDPEQTNVEEAETPEASLSQVEMAEASMDADDNCSVGANAEATDQQASEMPASPVSARSPQFFAVCSVALLLLMLVSVALANLKIDVVSHEIRAGLVLLLFFVVIVRQSTVHRESDHEIINAIDEERHEARGMVLREFVVFLPVVFMALLGLWLMREGGGFREQMSDTLHWNCRLWNVDLFRRWAPLEGLSTAAAGYILGGALGWVVRILFTLIFGREAFATGDIHMMAAAGCVAGWPVVVLGFFITTALALAGVLLTLPYKKARALPLGPWLFLSLLLTTVFYQPIVNSSLISRAIIVINVLILGKSQDSIVG